MKKCLLLSILMICSIISFSQKRALEHKDFDTWNRIRNTQISNDGAYVLYQITPGKGDAVTKIYTHSGEELLHAERGIKASFTFDNKFSVFTIKPALDSVNQMKRNKVKKDKMPKDSLAIFNLESNELVKVANVKGVTIPKKWEEYVFYQLEKLEESEEVPNDTTKTEKKKRKLKKMSKDNGYHLIAYNLKTQLSDTFKYVTKYSIAEKGARLIYHTTGIDSLKSAGVYYFNFDSNTETPLCRFEKGKFEKLTLSLRGDQVAFLTDLDTTKALQRNFQLRLWNEELDSAMVIAEKNTSGIPKSWIVNKNGALSFSEDDNRLFFGTSPEPLLQDTSLLKEEIIQVEIWNYKNGKLHTQQNAELDEDKKKTYQAVYSLSNQRIVQLTNNEIDNYLINRKKTNDVALGTNYKPYDRYMSWEGFPRRHDLYQIDVNSGDKKLIKQNFKGSAYTSPEGKFFYWYSSYDTAWFVYSLASEQEKRVDIPTSVADELNDRPDYPYSYSRAGWTTNDNYFLIYDRYDIWQYDPLTSTVKNVTNGRANKIRYRYIDLDKEEESIDPKLMLLHMFDETTKSEGFAQMKNFKEPKELVFGPFAYNTPIKATENSKIVFSKESHQLFPDLITTDLSFKSSKVVSQANPEIENYSWSTVESISWTSLDGIALEGLLYKPENFDPSKKYPMITYFYERNSDNIHRHWGAVPIRSIVNPAFYASRGYLIFIPDIVYKTGYPGESCYNAVLPGVTALIDKGFVDEKNIGVQGHSWGGYQVSYLVTQTDIFKAAEAGAVVSNMISAYGGIRWWTGLSRMFQYEHTQSRIGGTLWEYPMRYIENSPIFYTDKINTPLLLMHNDEDGHVPWYQGIEFFVALRRLGKPAWMLNYNGEPHWPTKWENIRDFNVRMQQFFDHYLKGENKPQWMSDEGIPAIQKGINKGYELIGE